MDILLSQAAEGFLLAKEVSGCSPYTIRNYRLTLRRLSQFPSPADPPLKSIASDHIRGFLHHLQTNKCAPAGVAPRPKN